MSKDDACKVTSASKHKERKPKKPHYIPRPWGKPYNYKCFQCPFTCMEKSHLYNHMKYSLCKNSLSLLIESDWPYKKGNILHPDQLRPFQQAHGLRAPGKDELEQMTRAEERQRQRRSPEEEGEDRESQGPEEEEEGGRGEGAEIAGLTKESSGNSSSRGEATECAAKKTKPPESELLMADMLSLEDQLLRARSVEVEAQLKHYKLSKTCLTAPGLLSEQWRLLTSSHTKAKSEGAQPRVSSSIPCYPPPPNLVDYQDPTGLNLSVLGVGYPISPSLFSYMNSAIPTAATGVAAQAHAQLAQLPFLASAAQLMHPASGAHTDRALIPPRLYYPFLCEHTVGAASTQSDSSKGLKTSTNSLEANPLSGFQPKVNLWKVPALRPGTTAVSPAGWVSPQRDSPDQGYRLGDKAQATAKEGKASWGLKRTGAPLRNHEAPVEKKPAMGFTLDLLKNIQTASTLNMAADKLLFQNSLQDAQLQTRPTELWYNDPLTSPNSETSSLSTCGGPNSQDSTAARTMGEGASESVAALLSDLSNALQEYQEAERKISHLEKEDLPAQRHLWEHLSKIRSELSHIHQALERTARQSDGPLDLSVKRDSTDLAGDQGMREDSSLKDNGIESEEEDEELEEKKEEEEDESERKAMRASLESRKQSLDMLIKMSQASVVNTEVLSPGGLSIRPSPAEALWPSRTTKCEADSSVLLCPDGRSVVFTDIPASAKTSKRPPSIQRLEAQCPPSPLTATEN
ncbi:proline-rich protein 35 [Seriola aureovittata]|uniref:proline-rich protein 35 n=1 Tax=Seriola aureovittata TaxID=2871759 RepID=UPI0024BE6139|nr:proline-rich protein 35 [Seriola aureovittata]